jgi:DNA-3-methyladenine glycosylase
VSLSEHGARLTADYYSRPVVEVARDLIGCTLLRDGTGGRIVETEAYHHSEPASHAFAGPTPRAKTLFEAPGVAYVYFSYGMHALVNAVCEPEGEGAAVLIRALEPTHGIDRMIARRGVTRERDLCSGPGKLGQALGITLDDNATSLVEGPIGIYLAGSQQPVLEVGISERIGITNAMELQWRFFARGNEHLSGPRKLNGGG